jgi:hypothetical protein
MERTAMIALLPKRRESSANAALTIWEEPGSEPPAPASALPVPGGPQDLAGHYDLTVSQPDLNTPQLETFNRWLARSAQSRGLSCALLHAGLIREAIRRLEESRLTIGFHLDYFALWHVADDPCARLAEAVQDAGGRSANIPARSRLFTDKAAAHAELLRRGLGVPATILLRPGALDRALTAAERAHLGLEVAGTRVFIKPANGFCGRGVVCAERTDPEALAAALTAARNHDRRDTFLLQREVRCLRLAGDDGVERPAYWRVLYCMGELLPFWWSKHQEGQPSYRRLTPAEIHRLQLQAVLAYVGELADLTGLDWFSTELCLSEGAEESKYRITLGTGRTHPVVAIDYLNDQCDVDVQSRWLGAPPDAVVRHLAERFAEAAWRQRQILRLQATHSPARSIA